MDVLFAIVYRLIRLSCLRHWPTPIHESLDKWLKASERVNYSTDEAEDGTQVDTWGLVEKVFILMKN